jgi:hypothetical protein
VLAAERLNAFQEAGHGRDAAGVAQNGFHTNSGDLRAVLVEQRGQGVEVVPGRNDDVAEGAAGLAARARNGQGRFGRAGEGEGRGDAIQGRVEPAVVVALELENLLATGESAGQPPGGVHGLGANAVETQSLGTRDQTADGGGDFEL